jgi:hypothetical protein
VRAVGVYGATGAGDGVGDDDGILRRRRRHDIMYVLLEDWLSVVVLTYTVSTHTLPLARCRAASS